MRWFKHLTDASDDEFIHSLEAEFGLAGYARWWKLCEIIGRKLKPTDTSATVTLPLPVWESYLKAKRKQLVSYLIAIEKQGRIKFEVAGELLRIELPKLLKFRDEYRRKSGHTTKETPDKVLDKNTDTDNREQKLEESKETSMSGSKNEPDAQADSKPSKTGPPELSPQLKTIGALYNRLAADWSKSKIGKKRILKLERRIRDCERTLVANCPGFTWPDLFTRIQAQSDFLRGQWQAWDLEWLVRTKAGMFNAERVWNRTYLNGTKTPSKRSAPQPAGIPDDVQKLLIRKKS